MGAHDGKVGTVAVVSQITKAGGPTLNGGNAASDPYFWDEVTFAGDTSYSSGGSTTLDTQYQALGAQYAFRTIVGIVPIDCAGYVVGWDSNNKKFKVYTAASTEATGDLSGVTFHVGLLSR